MILSTTGENVHQCFQGCTDIAGSNVRYYHDIRVSDNAKLIPEIFSYEIADNAVNIRIKHFYFVVHVFSPFR
jgi:hypothetical protein